MLILCFRRVDQRGWHDPDFRRRYLQSSTKTTVSYVGSNYRRSMAKGSVYAAQIGSDTSHRRWRRNGGARYVGVAVSLGTSSAITWVLHKQRCLHLSSVTRTSDIACLTTTLAITLPTSHRLTTFNSIEHGKRSSKSYRTLHSIAAND